MRTKNWLRVIACLLAACLLASCNNLSDRRLAAYDAALARRPATAKADPTVLHCNAVPPNLPFSVAYATVHGDFHSAGEEAQALMLRNHAVKVDLAPDFLIYVPQGASYAGSVSTYIGFGVTTSSPTYRPQGMAFCMREVGFATGIRINDQNMVTEVASEVATSGIQEGDTLVSIAGNSVERVNNQLSPWQVEALRHKPGDKVKLVWIRPGTGRMSGEAVLQPPREWPQVRSFTADYEARLKAAAAEDRNPVWSGR